MKSCERSGLNKICILLSQNLFREELPETAIILIDTQFLEYFTAVIYFLSRAFARDKLLKANLKNSSVSEHFY